MIYTHLVFFEFIPGAGTAATGGGTNKIFRTLMGVGFSWLMMAVHFAGMLAVRSI